jgi:hypothetical protein
MEATSNRTHWQRWLAAAAACGLILVAIGEKYPFTPFPMYSKVEPVADVLKVVDQNDRPIAISSVFGVGSAQAKKRFEKELVLTAKTREVSEAAPEQVLKAGRKFLKLLWDQRTPKKAAAISILKAKHITITLRPEGGFLETERLVGELAVTMSAEPTK